MIAGSQSHLWGRPLVGALLLAIGAYQRWLSPRKGFACAYRAAHGGTGCSGFAKVALRARGLAALPLVRARLNACRAAAIADATVDGAEPAKGQRKERWYERLDCGGADCSSCNALLFTLRGKPAKPDMSCVAGGCEVGPCDLSW